MSENLGSHSENQTSIYLAILFSSGTFAQIIFSSLVVVFKRQNIHQHEEKLRTNILYSTLSFSLARCLVSLKSKFKAELLLMFLLYFLDYSLIFQTN